MFASTISWYFSTIGKIFSITKKTFIYCRIPLLSKIFLDNRKKGNIWYCFFQLRWHRARQVETQKQQQLIPTFCLPAIFISTLVKCTHGSRIAQPRHSNVRSIFSALWNRTNPCNTFNEIPRVKWMKSDFLLNKCCQQYLLGTYVSSNWTEVGLGSSQCPKDHSFQYVSAIHTQVLTSWSVLPLIYTILPVKR